MGDRLFKKRYTRSKQHQSISVMCGRGSYLGSQVQRRLDRSQAQLQEPLPTVRRQAERIAQGKKARGAHRRTDVQGHLAQHHRVAPRGLHEGQSPMPRSGLVKEATDWMATLGYRPASPSSAIGRPVPVTLEEEVLAA